MMIVNPNHGLTLSTKITHNVYCDSPCWLQVSWICLFDAWKKRNILTNWLFIGDLPWYKEKKHLKQIQVKELSTLIPSRIPSK